MYIECQIAEKETKKKKKKEKTKQKKKEQFGRHIVLNDYPPYFYSCCVPIFRGTSVCWGGGRFVFACLWSVLMSHVCLNYISCDTALF